MHVLIISIILTNMANDLVVIWWCIILSPQWALFILNEMAETDEIHIDQTDLIIIIYTSKQKRKKQLWHRNCSETWVSSLTLTDLWVSPHTSFHSSKA